MATTTLYPVADSFVNDGAPTTNYGTNNNVYAGLTYGESLGLTRGWIKFDLSSLAGAKINSATLHASAYKAGKVTPYTTVLIQLEECSDNSWTEGGITWNNAPNDSCSGDPITLVTLYDTVGGTVSANVTSDVSKRRSTGFVSFRIKSDSETTEAYVKMWSNEHGNEMYLSVDYTLAAYPTGVPSAAAVGSPTVSRGAVTISPSGIPSASAFGNPTVSNEATSITGYYLAME